MRGGPHHKKRPKTRAGGVAGGGGGFDKPKARGSSASSAVRASGVQLKKSDVRFGNKEGGGTHFGSEERFAWQKSRYASDAMYTMPDVKAPPFSFGTSTRADWKKMMENTKDLYNPNCEMEAHIYTSYLDCLICSVVLCRLGKLALQSGLSSHGGCCTCLNVDIYRAPWGVRGPA